MHNIPMLHLVKPRAMLPVWQDSTREVMLEEVTRSAGVRVRDLDHLRLLRVPEVQNRDGKE